MNNELAAINYEGLEIQQTNEVIEKNPVRRFNMERFNEMLSKGLSFEELVDYCKTTYVNVYNYCQNCDAFLDIEDRIGETRRFVCKSCGYVNKL